MNAKNGTPIIVEDVQRRAREILSGPRESTKSAKDVMKNVRVSKDDPLVKRLLTMR